MTENNAKSTFQERAPPLVFIAIMITNAVNSIDLFRSWVHSPLERMSWLLLLIWLLPLIIYWITLPYPSQFKTINVSLAALSLAALFISVIGELNTAAYCGFALSIAACLPWTKPNGLWIPTSLAWMPAAGWFLARTLPGTSIWPSVLLRLLIIAAGTLSWIYWKPTNKGTRNG